MTCKPSIVSLQLSHVLRKITELHRTSNIMNSLKYPRISDNPFPCNSKEMVSERTSLHLPQNSKSSVILKNPARSAKFQQSSEDSYKAHRRRQSFGRQQWGPHMNHPHQSCWDANELGCFVMFWLQSADNLGSCTVSGSLAMPWYSSARWARWPKHIS